VIVKGFFVNFGSKLCISQNHDLSNFLDEGDCEERGKRKIPCPKPFRAEPPILLQMPSRIIV